MCKGWYASPERRKGFGCHCKKIEKKKWLVPDSGLVGHAIFPAWNYVMALCNLNKTWIKPENNIFLKGYKTLRFDLLPSTEKYPSQIIGSQHAVIEMWRFFFYHMFFSPLVHYSHVIVTRLALLAWIVLFWSAGRKINEVRISRSVSFCTGLPFQLVNCADVSPFFVPILHRYFI